MVSTQQIISRNDKYGIQFETVGGNLSGPECLCSKSYFHLWRSCNARFLCSWNHSNYSLLFLTSGWAKEISHWRLQPWLSPSWKTSFNVMLHTRPNLMRNVGCCYGNSIRWNFSLLASLTLHSKKNRMKRCGGCEDKREAKKILICLSPKERMSSYCNAALR